MGYAKAAELNGYPGLNAHLQQVKVLNEKQIALYMTLQGYNGAGGHGKHHHHHSK